MVQHILVAMSCVAVATAYTIIGCSIICFVCCLVMCSVNIKERLDFSCALFGPDGSLVANAPHLPVHLGAMSEAVRFQVRPTQFHDFLFIVTEDLVCQGPAQGAAGKFPTARAAHGAQLHTGVRPDAAQLRYVLFAVLGVLTALRHRCATTARAAPARSRGCRRATCCAATTRSWRAGRTCRTSPSSRLCSERVASCSL